ncbi:MAG: hypothetical protein DMF89_05790 [Acidobacteria bacterium]|nr:MAG: hypothetical protein DMF89_05790 [Acidobacteriota bacterium]
MRRSAAISLPVCAGLVVSAAALCVACGKKGPPLPPLNQLPAAPTALVAERRGSTVDVRLIVPATNTDGTRPADLTRVDVYALSAAPPVTPDEVFRHGRKVATILVNPPRDPDESPDEPGDDRGSDEKRSRDAKRRSRPEAQGVDQGTGAQLHDRIDAAEAGSAPARTYVGVGFNKRGRRGALSTATAVSLLEAPPRPSTPTVAYDETSITVTWPEAVPDTDAEQTLAYHVYEPKTTGAPLTERAVTEPRFVDKRIEWGAERCYAVRTVKIVAGLSVESDLSEAACVTPADTFPPAAPTGLTAVASPGAISLLWDASTATDLAGYVVFRAIAPATSLTPVTPSPIQETTFTDQVMPGAHATYAVQAMDKSGNASPLSSPIQETAR